MPQIPRSTPQSISWYVVSETHHNYTAKSHTNTPIRKKLMADSTKPELAQWYNTTLFNPVKKILIKAIKKG